MSRLKYPKEKDLLRYFELISEYLNFNNEPTPEYKEEYRGFNDLKSLIIRSQNSNYYKTFYNKASFLFININKGHYFSNGNKRLSIFISLMFAFINKYSFNYKDKKYFKELLIKIFPEYDLNYIVDFEEFNSIEFLFYNLAIIIASESKINIDELKIRVEKIFKIVLVKNT